MNDSCNAIVDLSHHNGDVDFGQLKAAGVIGVIHKATQGVGDSDPTYVQHRDLALNQGLLWGAYHFGTDSDGVQQAVSFLNVVGDPVQTLLALDFESNLTGPSMSLEEARAFVTHVKQSTDRYPVLYSGHYIKDLLGVGTDPVLANCPLWLAQYGPTAVVPPNWATWTLWQYTDGALGPLPHEIEGVGRFDRDMFNGSEADLRAFWST